jgi:hypothetical protein
MLLDVLKDTLTDTVKLIPFLYLTYLFMEYLERTTGGASERMLRKAGRFGPLFGGIVGVVPQCGFSAVAASLFSGGLITVGTMLAAFLATSDEMLPIMISERTDAGVIVRILLTKMVLGILTGFIIDRINRYSKRAMSQRHIHDLCVQDHCGCDEDEEHGGVFLPALIHTLHITAYILVLSFVIGLAIEGVGEETLAGFMTNQKVIGVLLAALIGLIPNCASSIMITELYLKGILASGQMLAGLLVGAGVGLLILFRNNRHYKEDFQITAVLYICGVAWGLLFEFLGITF